MAILEYCLKTTMVLLIAKQIRSKQNFTNLYQTIRNRTNLRQSKSQSYNK